MPAPSGFDHVSTAKSNSTRSNAPHPFDKLRAGSCKKRKDGAPSVGMMQCKDGAAGAHHELMVHNSMPTSR